MTERVFALPDLGEGLEEGTVAAWLVAEGDEVELNQPIAEIETAKAVVEMPSPFAGRIVRLHVAAGSEARVGEALVTFEVAAEVAGVGGGAGAPAAGPRRGADSLGATDAEGGAASPAALRPDTPARTVSGSGSSVAATPAVRKLAKELGVVLDTVQGTGSSGRVTREDVELAASARESGPSPVDAEVVAVTPVRRAIARRSGGDRGGAAGHHVPDG